MTYDLRLFARHGSPLPVAFVLMLTVRLSRGLVELYLKYFHTTWSLPSYGRIYNIYEDFKHSNYKSKHLNWDTDYFAYLKQIRYILHKKIH